MISLVNLRKFHRTMGLNHWVEILKDTIYEKDAQTFWRLGLLGVISEYGADDDLLNLIDQKLENVKPW